MKRFRRLLAGLAAPLLLLGGARVGRAAEVMPPAPSQYFNDYAGVVAPAAAQAMNAQLEQFEKDTSDQIVVAIFPHMESDSSIEDYTVRVANAWGLGQKSRANGAVLFVFVQDHTAYIATGYGLEGPLPDALCKRIIDEQLVPHFRDGDYTGGLEAGVAAIMAAVRGEYTGNGTTVAESRGGSFPPGDLFRIGLFLLILIIWSVARSRQHVVYSGGGRRSMWAGPMIFPGGGFGGGFGGGGGGGFGGGGGGFSGGGGSFGGGGAGGSW